MHRVVCERRLCSDGIGGWSRCTRYCNPLGGELIHFYGDIFECNLPPLGVQSGNFDVMWRGDHTKEKTVSVPSARV